MFIQKIFWGTSTIVAVMSELFSGTKKKSRNGWKTSPTVSTGKPSTATNPTKHHTNTHHKNKHTHTPHSHDPHESAEHQAADYQAHTDAAEHWDQAEQREERAVYYENRFDRETAQSMTLTDKSLGVHPHQALKQAKPAHQQQKPARQGRTQNIRRQRELSR